MSEQLAYLAGIVDGEGYIGVLKTMPKGKTVSPKYAARVQVRMVDEPAIRLLSETLGGSFYGEDPHSENGRPLFVWNRCGSDAERIVQTLLPWLRVKRMQALNLLEFRRLQSEARAYRTGPRGSFSEEYLTSMESFYLRGKELTRGGG